MSDSEVGICNSALSRIGQDVILSFDDDTFRAAQCALFYPLERDFMFRTYPWNFTTKRAILARSVTNPVWGYAYKYPLPVDFQRMISVLDEEYNPFAIEERCVVTDAETVKIKYSGTITSPAEFDKAFSEMLSVRLSAVLSYPLTESNTLAASMWQLYQEYEMDAFSADSQEGTGIALEDTTLIDIRV